MARIKLVTFPHKDGHHEAVLELEKTAPEHVFGQGEYTVMVGDTVVKDWDDLVGLCSGAVTEPQEVVRFKPIMGGVKTWAGKPPTECNICHKPITSAFIDGKTKMGPWAFMCTRCYIRAGTGLGVGRGQAYQKRGSEWVKTAG